MTEEARNPSFYDDGNPRPSGSNEGSGIGRFDVPASAQELEGFELDEGAILDFFADGDQFQLQESYVDDTIHSGEGSSNVRPWRARARRTLQEQVAHPKSIMARSASPSVASNSSASAIKTNPAVSAVHGRAKVAANRHMIKQVMKSFASADELENKIVKTAEERKVWELLRRRKADANVRKNQRERKTSLQSSNTRLSAMLKDRDDTIVSMTRARDEYDLQLIAMDDRIRSLESQLSRMETFYQGAGGTTGGTAYGEGGDQQLSAQAGHMGYDCSDIQYETQMDTIDHDEGQDG